MDAWVAMDAWSKQMRSLTTHVLDTATGRPAAGVRVVLRRAGEERVLAEAFTNADGRLGAPLIEGYAFVPGVYELSFHIGDYFRAAGSELGKPPFLDVIPVRIGAAGEGHYHVPLLVSPYGYSTYRGS